MTINERLRAVRKALNLTQEEFSAKLGISYAAVSMAERGKNGVSEQNIRAIVREFGVNEGWIRTGDGDMFQTNTEAEQIGVFMNGILNDDADFKLRFLSTITKLTPDEWEMLARRINEIADKK